MSNLEKTTTTTDERCFKPDLAFKRLFLEMSDLKKIKIINHIFNTKYSLKSKVTPQNTEQFILKGYEDKSFVRADLILSVCDEETGEEEHILFEFQSTDDGSMGFRMFVYTLNVSTTYVLDDKYCCNTPKSITLYTSLTKPVTGVDEVFIRTNRYEIDDLSFTLKKPEPEDYYRAEYPFINILAIMLEDLDKLDDTELDVFKVLYLYRYTKKKSLLLKEDYEAAIIKAAEIVKKYEGQDYTILADIFTSLCEDITIIAKESVAKNKKYKEVYNKMQTIQRSPGEEYVYNLRKDAENIGIQKGINIGEQKGMKKGEQKGMKKGINIGEQKGIEKGINIGEQKGIEKGINIGEQKGIEKGINIGEQKGIQKENLLIGKMINDKSDREISDFLEISIERVIQYRKDNSK